MTVKTMARLHEGNGSRTGGIRLKAPLRNNLTRLSLKTSRGWTALIAEAYTERELAAEPPFNRSWR